MTSAATLQCFTFIKSDTSHPIHMARIKDLCWFILSDLTSALGLTSEKAIRTFLDHSLAKTQMSDPEFHTPLCDVSNNPDIEIIDEKNARMFLEEVSFAGYGFELCNFVQDQIITPSHEDDLFQIKRKNFILKSGSAIRDRSFRAKTGDLVMVRPCGEDYEKKTYLGFMVGDVALGLSACFDKLENGDDTFEVTQSFHNPCILIPELGRLVYGCESWWSPISDPEQLKQISDQDINNVWYVQALKALEKKNDPS